MAYTHEKLRAIYDRTNGNCHLCHKKLAFTNYGAKDERGAWEVEHSRPRAKGGTDHGNNLFAAHILCNRQKSDFTTRTARGWNGKTRAPHSKAKRAKIRNENATAGAVLGGILGLAAGPAGVAFGAAFGAALGKSINPPKA